MCMFEELSIFLRTAASLVAKTVSCPLGLATG
jgi:hypothetical protein